MASGVLKLIRRAAKHVDRVARALDVPGAGNRIEKQTDFSRCDRPVLLLHGFLSSRRTFDVLERRLRRDGYGPFTLDLGGLGRTLNTRGIDDLADFVRAKVERIYARNPRLGPLTIVGHSKGGLVAAYYVKKLGGWRRTRAVVTLGTPHHGTPPRWCAGRSPRCAAGSGARAARPRAARAPRERGGRRGYEGRALEARLRPCGIDAGISSTSGRSSR
jgi:pimeloyl-ACP methyl ester carboxylesterase